MLSFSIYYKKAEKVLVVAEVVQFEIKEIEKNLINSNHNTINTSLNEIGIVTYINPKTNQFAALGYSLINSEEGTDIDGLCYNVKFQHSRSTNINVEKQNKKG